MDLGDLGCDDQSGNLEELVWRYISIADDSFRLRGIAKATISVRSFALRLAETQSTKELCSRAKRL